MWARRFCCGSCVYPIENRIIQRNLLTALRSGVGRFRNRAGPILWRNQSCKTKYLAHSAIRKLQAEISCAYCIRNWNDFGTVRCRGYSFDVGKNELEECETSTRIHDTKTLQRIRSALETRRTELCHTMQDEAAVDVLDRAGSIHSQRVIADCYVATTKGSRLCVLSGFLLISKR